MDQKPPRCSKRCPITPLCRHATILKVLLCCSSSVNNQCMFWFRKGLIGFSTLFNTWNYRTSLHWQMCASFKCCYQHLMQSFGCMRHTHFRWMLVAIYVNFFLKISVLFCFKMLKRKKMYALLIRSNISFQPHKCHYGACPPCRLLCEEDYPCGHKCNLRSKIFFIVWLLS